MEAENAGGQRETDSIAKLARLRKENSELKDRLVEVNAALLDNTRKVSHFYSLLLSDPLRREKSTRYGIEGGKRGSPESQAEAEVPVEFNRGS